MKLKTYLRKKGLIRFAFQKCIQNPGVFRISTIELFGESSTQLRGVKNFGRKAPSQMFYWVLNTPLYFILFNIAFAFIIIIAIIILSLQHKQKVVPLVNYAIPFFIEPVIKKKMSGTIISQGKKPSYPLSSTRNVGNMTIWPQKIALTKSMKFAEIQTILCLSTINKQ